MQTLLFPSNTLAEFYRLAVLLTGSIHTAETVMAAVLSEFEDQLAQMRNAKNRQAWLVARVRERCLAAAPEVLPAPRLLREEGGEAKIEVLEIEAYLVAQRFHRLPEPERSALALFYLDFFTIEDIARLLKTDEDALATTLGRARQLLQAELRAMRAATP